MIRQTFVRLLLGMKGKQNKK